MMSQNVVQPELGLNMAAERGYDLTAQQSQQAEQSGTGTTDTVATPRPWPMAGTSAGPPQASGASQPQEDVDILALSSDNSGSPAGIPSPFVSPPQQQQGQRRRRADMPPSRGSTPKASREPSPAASGAGSAPHDESPAFKRALHRRVEATGDTHPGRIARLEEQHEADREVIAWLTDMVTAHDGSIIKLRRAATRQAATCSTWRPR